MICATLRGGLGNQLFQIFACISYALKYNRKFVIPYKNSHEPNEIQRPVYWDTFFIELKPFISLVKFCDATQSSLKFHQGCFAPWSFDGDIPYHPHPFKLFGFFQSHKYFIDQYENIYKLLNIEEKRNKIKEKMIINYDNTISMHFRLGDYKNIPNGLWCILTDQYYVDSLKYIIDNTQNNKWNILYFCEKEDNKIIVDRINKFEKIYPSMTFTKVSYDIPDWEQMLLMSCCKHHIIANSTFSWWGAYLNKSNEKIVSYPSNWCNKFPPPLDLFPDDWIKN
tara:strand:- start:6578 stop:7420 length:843 start_codon:yes stop_codon:yes gene_type:complete